MTLTEFLLARIAEDEEAARTVPAGTWQAAIADDYGPGPTSYVVEAPPPAPGTTRTDQGDPDDPIWVIDSQDGALIEYIARFGPARVLAECEAKRRVVEESARLDGLHRDGVATGPEFDGARKALGHAIRLLALPCAGHPDYDEAWRP